MGWEAGGVGGGSRVGEGERAGIDTGSKLDSNLNKKERMLKYIL